MEQVLVKQIAKKLPKTLWADERKPEYSVSDSEQLRYLAIVTTKTLDENIMKVFFTDTKESVLVEGGLEAAMDLIGEHYA